MPALLNPRHERFACAIVAGQSNRAAYLDAGYCPTNNVWVGRLRRRPDIAARIRELQDSAAERAGITHERVLRELARIAFSDIRSLIDCHGDKAGAAGVVGVKRPQDLDDDIAAAISEVVPTSNGLRVKLHDKRAALLDLGRHLGLFETQRAEAGRRKPAATVSDQAGPGADGEAPTPPGMSVAEWEKLHAGD